MRVVGRTLAAGCLGLAALAAAPGTASADIRLPDRHGGEPMIEYQGKGKSWTAEINGLPGSRTISWVSVVGRAVCRKPGSTWRGGWTYLIDRKVKFDKKGRLTYRPQGRYERVYHRVWKLRLSANGERLTGSIRSHWRSSAGESCRGNANFSAKHVMLSTFYDLGTYTGTTSQGAPLSFRAAIAPPSDFRAGTFDLRDVSVPVRLACTNGATIDRTLTVQPESDGYTFWPPVIGGAVDEMYLSSPAPAPVVNGTMSVKFAHDHASGTLSAEASIDQGDEASVSCESGPLTMAVSRR
jgi:hypothetical protein